MNADGSNQTNLSNHPSHDAQSRLSPDGVRIAFKSNRVTPAINVMNADGSNQTPLTDNIPGHDSFPAWSPDSTRIAFHSYGPGRDDNGDIYVMNVDGSNPSRLTNNPARDKQPDWGT